VEKRRKLKQKSEKKVRRETNTANETKEQGNRKEGKKMDIEVIFEKNQKRKLKQKRK
jgi:hypothetical protein